MPYALSATTAAIPASGDGLTAASPKRILFIITDGVADYYDGSGNRVLESLNPTQCAALKAKGVEVLTLYTTYIPLTPP